MHTLNRSAVSLGMLVAFFVTNAEAVPAFARQTGMACSQCHTTFPELTPFGRQFKAGGYTLSMTKQVAEGGTGEKRVSLELPAYVPVGLMAVTGFTHINTTDAPTTKNDDILFPQEFAIFLAGKITPKVGAFMEFVYDGATNQVGLGLADIRFAHQLPIGGKNLIVGASLNNTPTVSDLWNSTPQWSAPYAPSSASAPTPATATAIEGKFRESSMGLGLYAFWDGLLYGEFAVYRSAPRLKLPLSAAGGATNIIEGVVPYWRVAVEKGFGSHSLSAGTFGLTGTVLPGGTSIDTSTDPPSTIVHELTLPGDRFTDIGFDTQYQYIGTTHIMSATASYIYESQTLAATHSFGKSDRPANELHSFRASAGYTYDRILGARATFNTMRGSSDATLYGGGGPRATTLSGELFAMPWQNLRLGLTYTQYLDFDGAARNYDGRGRNASDNNTLYAYAWLVF